jgi:hypothetical protein
MPDGVSVQRGRRVARALAALSACDRERLLDRLGELRDVDEVMRRPGLLAAEATP